VDTTRLDSDRVRFLLLDDEMVVVLISISVLILILIVVIIMVIVLAVIKKV